MLLQPGKMFENAEEGLSPIPEGGFMDDIFLEFLMP